MHTIASNQQRRIQAYIVRGRRFRECGESELEAAFERVLRIVAVDPVEPVARQIWDDLFAEYGLRGSEPPTDKFKLLVEAFISKVQAHLRSLGEDVLDDINQKLYADYDRDVRLQH